MLCINLLDKIGQTPSKVDSDEDPQKNHTIPADVLPNDSEDLLYNVYIDF